MSEMSAAQTMYGIAKAYRDKKSKEEILSMYAAVQDKEEIDTSEADRTYVHLAAQFADADAVTYLLSQGLKANAKDGYQRTPLHALAEGSRDRADIPAEEIERTAKVLLDAKVSALIRDDNDGSLCYHSAAKSENAAFLDAMIQNKVKLDMTDNEGRTVLHLIAVYPARSIKNSLKYEKNEEAKKKLEARLERIFDTAKALIAYGIDPEVKDGSGKTAADYAAEYELGKFAVLFKGEYDESDASMEDKTAAGGKTFQQACKDGDLKAVEALIRLGKDVNEVSNDSLSNEQTPLAVACMRAFPEAVDSLLKAGADPNFRTGENGRSALFYMINYGDFGRKKDDAQTMGKILKSLLAYKLNVNGFVDNNENTPLTLAANPRTETGNTFGSSKQLMRRELLDNTDCNINAANKKGITALMYIVQETIDNVENDLISLLEKGADPAAKDKDGNTALMYASGNRNKAFAKSFADLMFSFGDPMAQAVNNEKKSAMDIAVEQNNEELVKYLLAKM